MHTWYSLRLRRCTYTLRVWHVSVRAYSSPTQPLGIMILLAISASLVQETTWPISTIAVVQTIAIIIKSLYLSIFVAPLVTWIDHAVAC